MSDFAIALLILLAIPVIILSIYLALPLLCIVGYIIACPIIVITKAAKHVFIETGRLLAIMGEKITERMWKVEDEGDDKLGR